MRPASSSVRASDDFRMIGSVAPIRAVGTTSNENDSTTLIGSTAASCSP